MTTQLKKLNVYYLISILSIFIAVVGFSYNTWRLEVSEENTTIRAAAFDVYNHLADLEAILYAAYYDKNLAEGSPRKAWVKVGVILDLSQLISKEVVTSSTELKTIWQDNWQHLQSDPELIKQLIAAIDDVRFSIKKALSELK